jgi:filamentous hemagglutinin
MRQIASQGKDALALLYQQTGDPRYQTAYQALMVSTSGNEIGGALAMPSGGGGNLNRGVQEGRPASSAAAQGAENVGAGAGAGRNVGAAAVETATPVTSGGTASVVTAPRLREQLTAENLANIAAQDARLALAVNGSGGPNLNFSVGSGTAAEALSLGRIWVGDGARPLGGVPGGLISADGTRVFRPPTPKPNAPAEFNPTGIQANFQVRDSNTGAVTSNGHMVIK